MIRLALIIPLLSLIACGGDMDYAPASDSLEAALAENSTWPYEVVGVLDIIDAGYADSDAPQWAVGSIVTDDDEWGVLIEIDGAVIARAGIDIDSGKKVRAWLDAPISKAGDTFYPVSKLQSL